MKAREKAPEWVWLTSHNWVLKGKQLVQATFCQLDTSSGHLGKGHFNWENAFIIFLISDRCRRTQSTVGDAAPRLVVFSGAREQAEQTAENKPVSSTSPGSLFQFPPPPSCLNFLHDGQNTVTWNKLFLSQDAVGYGVCHSNTKQTRTQLYYFNLWYNTSPYEPKELGHAFIMKSTYWMTNYCNTKNKSPRDWY